MNNRKKIKDYKKKLQNLETLSFEHKEGTILSGDYKKHLTDQIEFVKSNNIKNIEYNINKDLKEIKILKEIKFKLKNNLNLNDFEKSYILVNI
ncbi:hypothetical protein CXF68_17855 [Tenacibaculum sp. Bg11-29]|uniref:hypothetical protein n=1 Tax=Tenacibaculum sp. Bg11-29 TaxID=2058306 RepID=UPI000C3316A7|nr:hypothetical protein [Tenacibaculum sp. Bg11-29]PKH52442.1 hypothetical protein CXF68_17855 [Tenacibaculum sp. Bg11-29]